jgi:DNA-binding PucR family transcriptional regulator
VRVGEVLDVPSERTGPPDPGGEPAGDGGDGAGGPDGPDRPAAGATPEPETEQRQLHELLLASVPASLLRSSAERLLGPLRDYDARHNAELMPTLRSFLSCDGSWSVCASVMYVHVNTVRYRIGRIEALTGRDLSVLADRVDFFLALRGA